MTTSLAQPPDPQPQTAEDSPEPTRQPDTVLTGV